MPIYPNWVRFINGLPVVLLAVIGGIGAVGGALFGGLVYAAIYLILPDLLPDGELFGFTMADLLAIGPALAGVSLGRNPNGAVNETVRSWREKRAQRAAAAAAPAPEPPVLTGIDGFTDDEVDELDREVGLAEEPAYAVVRAGRS